jgi:hypothetical protein
MAEPVTLTAIAAGAAVVGAVQGVYSAVNGDSGFNVSPSSVHYPMQFPANQFAIPGQSVGWDILKFYAIGAFYDNELAVAASGYVSNDDGDLVGWHGSDHPNIPVNRFILLQFDKSGSSENLSGGLLNVNISPWAGDNHIAEGNAEDPWVALRVTGRFDPRGHGDMQYSFKLGINSHGRLHLSNVEYNGTAGDFDVTHDGDHISIKLNQPFLGEN